MARNGKRLTIARGIYQDVAGFSIQVCVAGHRREIRKPLGTHHDDLLAAREALRAQLAGKRARVKPGTLEQDAPRYLAAVRAMPSYTDRKHLISLWVSVLGDHRRDQLDAATIRTALNLFLRQYSPQTCRHLLRSLQHLFSVLDGKGAANPARDVPLPPVPAPLPRAMPLLTVARIIKQIRRRSKTRARLAVIATTGMAHTELRKLRPQDLDWVAGTILIHGRRKGAGTRPRCIPMTTHSRLALRIFVQAKAWGDFSAQGMHGRFTAACKKLGLEHYGYRPYDLRHTLATTLAGLTRDEGAVQAWLGHTNVSTTQRYTLGSVNPRLVAGGSAMNGAVNRSVERRALRQKAEENARLANERNVEPKEKAPVVDQSLSA